jgi:hypothetical protein
MIDFFQSLVPTLLVILGGVVTWFLKSKVEELRAAEERLQSDRRKIYSQILDPYIRFFSDSDDNGIKYATELITSFEYKKTGYELNLIGSDDVVNAHNDLMTHGHKAEASGEYDNHELLRLLGTLLLEIRRSLGNKKTKLSSTDMLRASIKDIDKIEENT